MGSLVSRCWPCPGCSFWVQNTPQSYLLPFLPGRPSSPAATPPHHPSSPQASGSSSSYSPARPVGLEATKVHKGVDASPYPWGSDTVTKGRGRPLLPRGAASPKPRGPAGVLRKGCPWGEARVTSPTSRLKCVLLGPFSHAPLERGKQWPQEDMPTS